MKLPALAFAASLAFSQLSLALAGQTHTDPILIRAGRLIDTVAGNQLGPTMIAVEDGRIVKVAPDLDVKPGAKVIDLSDYTVLPGLIDSHTHLTFSATNQDPLAELER